MWSDLALQFLGVATNPVVALALTGLLALARRRSTVRLCGAAAGAGFGAVDALGAGMALGSALVAVSAAAGLLAAEIVLSVLAPLGVWLLSGALALLASLRRRRGR